jgi:hypothetical protein
MNGYLPEKRSTLPPVEIGVSEISSVSAGPLPGSYSSSSGFLRIYIFFFAADLDTDPLLPESLIYLRYFSQK